MAGAGCLRGAMEVLLEITNLFLRVARAFRVGVLVCGEARCLRERHVVRAQEGGGLEAEE